MQSLSGRKNHEFSSGGTTGKDFKLFAGDWKRTLNKVCKRNGRESVNFNRGHYYLSGFIKADDKYIYRSVSDVRHFRNEWLNKILIRTAEHANDFTGGSNGYTDIDNMEGALIFLFDSQN